MHVNRHTYTNNAHSKLQGGMPQGQQGMGFMAAPAPAGNASLSETLNTVSVDACVCDGRAVFYL